MCEFKNKNIYGFICSVELESESSLPDITEHYRTGIPLFINRWKTWNNIVREIKLHINIRENRRGDPE
jgi:hypothetical protein